MLTIQALTPSVQTGNEPVASMKENSEADAETAKAFEALFVGNMVDEMMKTVDMGSSMGEHPAEMWRSVLSDALAVSLVENGGLGIAENIQLKITAYKAATGETHE